MYKGWREGVANHTGAESWAQDRTAKVVDHWVLSRAPDLVNALTEGDRGVSRRLPVKWIRKGGRLVSGRGFALSRSFNPSQTPRDDFGSLPRG